MELHPGAERYFYLNERKEDDPLYDEYRIYDRDRGHAYGTHIAAAKLRGDAERIVAALNREVLCG